MTKLAQNPEFWLLKICPFVVHIQPSSKTQMVTDYQWYHGFLPVKAGFVFVDRKNIFCDFFFISSHLKKHQFAIIPSDPAAVS